VSRDIKFDRGNRDIKFDRICSDDRYRRRVTFRLMTFSGLS
jgi:hypothetical protein